MDRTRRSLLALLVGALVMLAGMGPALAHAQLLDSTPQDGAVLARAPEQVDLTFDEPVRAIAGAGSWVGSDGVPHEVRTHARDEHVLVDLPAEVPDGTSTLTYRVISADGHPVSGTVTFSVGTPAVGTSSHGTPAAAASEAGTVLIDVLTVIQYLALLLSTGLMLFAALVARASPARQVFTRSWTGAARPILIVIATLASFALVPARAAHAAGRSTWTAGLTWPPVVAAGLVLLGAVLLVIGVHAEPTGDDERIAGPALRARRDALPIGGAVLALMAPLLAGHSASVSPRPLMLLADGAHLLAGAFWSGGLIGLIAVILALRRGRTDPDARTAGIVLRRFSTLALVSVLVLTAAGTTMAVLILDTPRELISTGWGRALLAKLAIVGVAVALAAGNRRRLLPALDRHGEDGATWARLLRTVRSEAALLLGAIVVTGVLVNLDPVEHHRPEAAGPVSVHAMSQGLVLTGTMTPGVRGPDTLTMRIEYEGEVLSDVPVTVSARQRERDIGPISVRPTFDPETGSYSADLSLPTSGTWQLQVTAQVDDFTSPVAVATIVMP